MAEILDLFGALLLLGGTVFLLLGGVGLQPQQFVTASKPAREDPVITLLPKAATETSLSGAGSSYNRIQAGTKATTLGTLLSLAGVAFLYPEWTLKLLLIGVFLLFTNPLSSQVLARAAHRGGAPQAPSTTVDRLEEDQGKRS